MWRHTFIYRVSQKSDFQNAAEAKIINMHGQIFSMDMSWERLCCSQSEIHFKEIYNAKKLSLA